MPKTQQRQRAKKRHNPFVWIVLLDIILFAGLIYMVYQPEKPSWLDSIKEHFQTVQPAPEPKPAFYEEPLAELDEFVQMQPGHVSLWMMDLTTEEVHECRPGGYYCASTLKAPYALWLCKQDEAGQINLDKTIKGSTGWELLHEMIAYSSNDATDALSKVWPGTAESGFSDFLAELGFSSPQDCEITVKGIHGWITARDGGLAMKAIYDYCETESENADRLRTAFLDADHSLLWSPAPAAKKYGSWDNALHDMMIVYGEKPYILSVFTDWGDKKIDFPAEGVSMMDQLGRLAAEAVGAE